jgi:tRNA1(Val) A37 N6-methylase TrmN6
MESIAAFGALIVACCGVGLTAFALRRKTDDNYLARIERELEEMKVEQASMKRDLEICKSARDEFHQQNFVLMAKLLKLEEGR